MKEGEQLREKQRWHDETKRSLEREIVASQEREEDAGVPTILHSAVLICCLNIFLPARSIADRDDTIRDLQEKLSGGRIIKNQLEELQNENRQLQKTVDRLKLSLASLEAEKARFSQDLEGRDVSLREAQDRLKLGVRIVFIALFLVLLPRR